MKNVIYHPEIKQPHPALYGLAQQAIRRLEEIIGPYAEQVEAEWDGAEDPNRRRYVATLSIRNPPEEVRSNFVREELEDSEVLTIRLARLWGDLLQARSHRLLQELNSEGVPGSN